MENLTIYTDYSTAVGKYGVGSDQAMKVRRLHEHDKEFIKYAEAVDRLRKRLLKKRAAVLNPEKRELASAQFPQKEALCGDP